MADSFLGRGWKYPVQVDSRGGVALSSYEQNIKESIWIILSTAKGERVMRPEFGCGIQKMVFEVMDTATAGLIKHHVEEALLMWEPRIDLLDVRVSTEEADQGRLLINIDYRVITTNNTFNMVYPFYITR